MSNRFAIANVTAALRLLLGRHLADIVPGAQVSTVRPNLLGTDQLARGVNLFLYMVSPNPGFQNDRVPTRRADGTLQAVPQIALNLHYVFTFFGDETKLESQLLLGATMAALRQQPVLTPALIRDTIRASSSPDLTGSDLAEQRPLVTITPTPLDAELLSRIWSVFYQIPYSISAVFQCGPVLIDSDVVATPSPPVKEIGGEVGPG